MRKSIQLLSTKQAAEILGLQPQTLDYWRVSGRGPAFIKISRTVRYRMSDIEEFIEKNVRRSTCDPGLEGEAA